MINAQQMPGGMGWRGWVGMSVPLIDGAI